MEEQFDLANAVAIILGSHITELVRPTRIYPEERMGPNLQTAYRVWQKLAPHFESHDLLREQVQTLVDAPSESARLALAEEIRRLFANEPELRAEIKEITDRSAYASLYGSIPTVDGKSQAPLTGSDRNAVLTHLAVVVAVIWVLLAIVVVIWSLSGLFSLLKLARLLLPVPLIIRGVLVGRFADRLHIRRPHWVGAAAMLPGNILLILVAMAGYRRVDSLPDDQVVCYSLFTQIFTAYLAAMPPLLFILLSVINPAYMVLFFEDWLGIAFLAIAIVAFALGVLSLWFGFWRNKAQTGIGIALVSTIAGWSSLITIWVILLGPAAVQLKQTFS
jgi:hypothetical protein